MSRPLIRILTFFVVLCFKYAAYVARVMAKITASRPELAWLEPPAVGGTLTVASVSGSEGPEAYQTAVRAWGASVWAAWTAHHERVRALVDANPG